MTNSDIEQDSRTPYPSRSLRVIHILLISSATVFAFGYAALKFFRQGAMLEVLGAFIAGLVLSIYLRSFTRKTA